MAPSPGLADCAKHPMCPRLSGIHWALQSRHRICVVRGRSCCQHHQSRPDSRLRAHQVGSQHGVDASHIREYCELFKPSPGEPPTQAHRLLGELQTIRSGIIAGLTEWKNRKNSGIVDVEAQALAEATISHFTSQLGVVDEAIARTIDNDCDLRSKRDLLLSISGVGETLAGVVLAELPGPDVLRSSAEVVAYAGLNPRQYQSGTSVVRATRISKIGNAVLRAALYMPALSAMRYNPAIVALVTRLKSQGRLKPKQIVVAAMRKLLVLCFGVLKTRRPFDAAIAMGC